MLAKRIGVVVVSFLIGMALTQGLLLVIQMRQSNVTIAYFGYEYFALTSLFLGAAVLVWLDHIMKTHILPG